MKMRLNNIESLYDSGSYFILIEEVLQKNFY